jgi:hypothetical protein
VTLFDLLGPGKPLGVTPEGRRHGRGVADRSHLAPANQWLNSEEDAGRALAVHKIRAERAGALSRWQYGQAKGAGASAFCLSQPTH